METASIFLTSNYETVDLNDEDMNETDAIESSSMKVARVDISALITYFLLFVALLCFGVVANAIGIVAARWPTRTRYLWRRLVIGNLCAVQLVACVIISPIGLTTTIAGFSQRPLPTGVCNAYYGLVHGFLAATVFSFCLLTALRWNDLRRACAGELQDDDRSGSHVTGVFLSAGPWVSGVMSATLAVLEFPDSVAFFVCRDSVLYQAESSGSTSRMKSALANAYAAATSICVVVLGTAYCYHKSRMNRLMAGWKGRCEQTILLGGNNCENSKRNQNKKSNRGQAGNVKPSGKKDGRRPTNLTVDGCSNIGCSKPEEEEEKDEGVAEDTFDTKMRLKFQKKSRSSGRRHTVANIGLPDLGNKRRSSFETAKGKASSPASDYQYVRKWSVDITALANQLENPKMHAGSFPTLGNSSPSSGGSYMGSRGVVMTPEVITGNAHRTSLLLPGPSMPTAAPPRLSGKKPPEICTALETPSIVVSLTPDTEADTLDDSFESRCGLEEAEMRVTKAIVHSGTVAKTTDDKGVLAAMRELNEVLRTTIAMFLWLVVVLLWAISILAEVPIRSRLGLNFAHNLDLLLQAACLFQAISIPVFQIWSNKDLRDEVFLLKSLLKSLRCVCYCNVGPGRSCMIRRRRCCEKRQQKV